VKTAVAVPTSDAEVFETYYPHVKFLVQRAHIRPENVEDYAMTLMAKFIEKGVLTDFDPNHESGANFKTFLSNFVNAYLRHFAERDAINAYRSRLSTDIRVGEKNDVPLMDYMGQVVSDDTETVEVSELVNSVRAQLLKAGDEKMCLFYEMVLLQNEEHGKVDVDELAKLFGVTRSSIYNWRKKLREVFEQCL
jgi:RNA polymerase sigma factor (sigma-70 family)